MTDIQITAGKIDVQRCIEGVMSAHSGGIDVFIGTVRDATQGRRVIKLEFEAYEPMAISEMKKIAAHVINQWPVHKIVIHHRTGQLQIGQVAVVIAVSAAHRAAAFDACRYAIDTLKQTVPIWKKEFFDNEEVWVSAHP